MSLKMFKVLSVFLVVLLLQLHSTNGQITVGVAFPDAVPLVAEGTLVNACFSISEAPTSDAGLVVNVKNANSDIAAVDQDLTFAADTTELMQCIDIEVIEDDRIDGIDTINPVFTVELFEGDLSIRTDEIGSLLTSDTTTARTLKFEQSSYILAEGGQLDTVCVSINGYVDQGSFSATLEYTGVTATAVDDYLEGSTEVSFSSVTVDQMVCVTVTANDDELVEDLETFTVALASVGSTAAAVLTIDTEMSTTTVTIIDADSNCVSPPGREGVEFTISDSQSVAGELVVDLDAVATYSCMVDGYVIEDANELTCVSLNDTAQWYPAEAPMCVQGPTEEPKDTDPTTGSVAVTQSTAILTYILCAALVTKHLLHM